MFAVGLQLLEGEPASAVSAAFGTALSTIQSDVMGMIAQAVPYGLAIMGAMLVVTIGVKAFKRFSK
ncbi:protein of unknown function [Ruminococcaceae bacterium BL-6]|nr:protein of unknown function [Ruminococcaceae bacterium BL-6]CAB1247991.1 protein of unknown function [Ruminococcaceae bacterium BL-6]